jgi:FkbM family methyltransferase
MNIISEYKYGKIIYNNNDYYMGTCISEYGEYCDSEISIINQIIKKGDVILDIGANIGLMTIPFSKMVGQNGKVMSYEPQPEIYRILCGNIAINNLTNVYAHNLAVGDNNNPLFIPKIDYGKSNNFGGISLQNSGETKINQIKIDDLSLDKLNFMKIDVESMELNVLNGSYYTIKKHRPVIYVENDRKENSPDLLEFLLSENYNCYWHVSNLFELNNYKNNNINVFDINYVCVNVLAIPSELNLNVNLKKIDSNLDWFK